jgi:hypothetical protein
MEWRPKLLTYFADGDENDDYVAMVVVVMGNFTTQSVTQLYTFGL